MGTYVTATGFVRESLAAIKSRFVLKFRQLWGSRVDTSEELPAGQLIGFLSDGKSESWDIIQEVHDSLDPNSAEGAALDRVCAYTGVKRIGAAATYVNALLYTDAKNVGVVIASGRQARRVRGALVFSLAADTTISATACQDIYLSLEEVTAGEHYTLVTTLGSVTVTGASTVLATLELLAAAINALAVGIEAQVCQDGVAIYPVPATVGEIQVSALCLRLVAPGTTFGVTDYSSFALVECGSVGKFVCNFTGANTVEIGELSSIVTSETGWVGVDNLVVGVTGRDVESNEDLRIRRESAAGNGYATDAAIVNYIYNHVPGIVGCKVISNRTMGVDSSGRPPKSFEVTVVGGDDAAVAAAIWTAQPGGIESYGATTVVITDSEGEPQTIKFSRPTGTEIYVAITYSLYADEAFPADGETMMRNAVLAYVAEKCTVGKKVFADRIQSAIIVALPSGLAEVNVLVGATPNPTGESLAIDGRHYASLSSARINIVRIA